MTNCYNLYYELPGAGGGNLKFETMEDAKREFESMVTSYPDVFAQLSTEIGVMAGYIIETYDNSQDD